MAKASTKWIALTALFALAATAAAAAAAADKDITVVPKQKAPVSPSANQGTTAPPAGNLSLPPSAITKEPAPSPSTTTARGNASPPDDGLAKRQAQGIQGRGTDKDAWKGQ